MHVQLFFVNVDRQDHLNEQWIYHCWSLGGGNRRLVWAWVNGLIAEKCRYVHLTPCSHLPRPCLSSCRHATNPVLGLFAAPVLVHSSICSRSKRPWTRWQCGFWQFCSSRHACINWFCRRKVASWGWSSPSTWGRRIEMPGVPVSLPFTNFINGLVKPGFAVICREGRPVVTFTCMGVAGGCFVSWGRVTVSVGEYVCFELTSWMSVVVFSGSPTTWAKSLFKSAESFIECCELGSFR